MWWITDIVLPSAQQLYGNIPAEDVTYANTSSGLTAIQVQAAIDELAGGALRTQVLTTEEYNAVTDKDENTLYILSDDTTEADIEAHMADTDIHVTAEEKAVWNAGVLPSVSASDNGKFLRVVNGAWAAVSISNANGVSF